MIKGLERQAATAMATVHIYVDQDQLYWCCLTYSMAVLCDLGVFLQYYSYIFSLSNVPSTSLPGLRI